MKFSHLSNYVLICGMLGLSIIVILITGILYDAIKKIKKQIILKRDESTNDNTSIDIRILTHINLYVILANMILLLFRFLYININLFDNLHTDKYCMSITKIAMVLFQLTRTIMYIIFIRRLQVIYVGTMFELKNKYVYILFAITTIYAITFISYLHWPALFISTYNPYFGCSIRFTLHIYQPILFSFISILELLIPVCCLYLFIYPLYQLVQHQDDKEIKNQLYSVMIKFSILQSAAICSAFVLIIISFTFVFGYYFLMIDALINGTMLILLNPLHNSCYKRICCICHTCCLKGCNQFAIWHENKLRSNPIQTDRFTHPIEPINVLENDFSNNYISDVNIATPIDLLLSQATSNMKANSLEKTNNLPTSDGHFKSMSNMYKNAAIGQAAFTKENIGGIIGVKSPTVNNNTLYKSSLSVVQIDMNPTTVVQIDRSKSPSTDESNSTNVPMPSDVQLVKSDFNSRFVPKIIDEIRESREVEPEELQSIRDAMKHRANEHFNRTRNQKPLKLNTLSLSKYSTSVQSEGSVKSNTLVLIDYESTDL